MPLYSSGIQYRLIAYSASSVSLAGCKAPLASHCLRQVASWVGSHASAFLENNLLSLGSRKPLDSKAELYGLRFMGQFKQTVLIASKVTK